MEIGLGWELRISTPEDEVREVLEENAQGEGRVWRKTWGLEERDAEPRQGGPEARTPVSREPQKGFDHGSSKCTVHSEPLIDPVWQQGAGREFWGG